MAQGGGEEGRWANWPERMGCSPPSHPKTPALALGEERECCSGSPLRWRLAPPFCFSVGVMIGKTQSGYHRDNRGAWVGGCKRMSINKCIHHSGLSIPREGIRSLSVVRWIEKILPTHTTRTYTYTCTYSTHTLAHRHSHTHTCTYACTQTHVQMYTRMHTHGHTHVHTHVYIRT